VREEKLHMEKPPECVSWNEPEASELAETREWYFRRLGWTVEVMELPGGTYSFFKFGERLAGGMVQPADNDEPIAWMPCLAVANLEDALSRSTSLGAKLRRRIKSIEGLGSLAIITNPQGATLGLWQSVEKTEK